jgi:DNA-binding transcriptional ArsR family regulator
MTIDETSLTERVALLKVIADETRLRILGLLSERVHTGKELADRLSLTAPTVSHHIRKLTDAGIVTSTADAQRHNYALNTELLRDVRKSDATSSRDGTKPDLRQKTLRNFFDGDRLKTIPAQRKQRVIILQKLLERFEPGRSYPEREVNDLLRPAHEDVATLRRELVNYGFMVREKGTYEVADTLPPRTTQIAQEITGDEHAWLGSLLRASIREPGE